MPLTIPYKTHADFRRDPPADYVRFCFADPAHADAFLAEFGSEKITIQPGLTSVRLSASLVLFAIAGIVFWRFRYYLATEEWMRTFGEPLQAPRHVFIWFLIAIGLCFVGAFIAPSPL
jgi:hypothetical protein